MMHRKRAPPGGVHVNKNRPASYFYRTPPPSPPLSAVEVETIDPYDLLDPVDLLAQMPKDFYDNIVRSHSLVQPSLWIDVLLLLLFWFGFCTC